VIPNELEVDWTHDRMCVSLPVWRDRSPLWLAVLGAWCLAVIWLGAAYLLGAVAILWTTSPDTRKVVLELDAHHVVLRHRRLFRDRVERLALHAVSLGPIDPHLFVITCGAKKFTYRWMGSEESLGWLREQIERARDRAVAPMETPAPPPELGQLRSRAQTPQAPANTTSGSSHTPV
jgi:hypothetical protein